MKRKPLVPLITFYVCGFGMLLILQCKPLCLCVFRAEHYWWRGQNRKTLRVGQFPRHVVTSVAGLSAQDISRPLKHSFIHTGHGDTDPHRSWGHADRIDRSICRNTLTNDRY